MCFPCSNLETIFPAGAVLSFTKIAEVATAMTPTDKAA
jgi:hypothetical protein